MNASLVCLLAALTAQPQMDTTTSVYKPTAGFESIIRGQTPTYDEIPNSGQGTGTSGPTFVVPPNGGTVSPFQPAPLVQDPFLGQPGFGAPPPSYFAFGTNGPQPYKFGWSFRGNAGYIPSQEVRGNPGDFSVTEFGFEKEFTTLLPSGWIFSFTDQYDLRLWDGPLSSTPGSVGLPSDVHRFGWDFELSTPANTPWSYQLGFNPSINSSFERHTTSDAWNWDGRAVAFYRASPHWMLAFGAGFWDRVNDRVIPYAGAVWTPDDRWEWRMVFPKPRVSYFLGAPYGVPTWLYVSGEYHIEAYEVELANRPNNVAQEKIELEDWRIVIGLRKEAGCYSSYIEAGWIFGREVDFLNTPGFSISSGFIVRGGVQF